MKKLRALQLYADNYWKTAFHGGCGSYTGPKLAWGTVACTATDGSYWAVQEWQRKLPDYGLVREQADDAYEVHLSHWTGALPVLTVNTDWSWHQWNHLYGTFTYDGVAGLRVQVDLGRSAARQLRPQRLPRHLQLGLRHRLAPREQLPDPQRRRGVLLQRQPAPRASGRQGHRVSRDDHGPRRHARTSCGRASRPARTTSPRTPSGTWRSPACTTRSAARTDASGRDPS